ncbi:MAG: hypothetical protein JEZ14_09020 [Marinilabiliaceae bacterium]|nr:hypothetical protein [Marinilabiliaceae bacterium]
MDYILEYFDSFFEDVSMEFTSKLRECDISSEIVEQRKVVQKELRDQYYGLCDENSDKRLKRYTIRIVNSFIGIKDKIDDIEFGLVAHYPTNQNDYKLLCNYYSAVNQIFVLVNMLNQEFGINTNLEDKYETYELEEKSEHTFRQDYKEIVRCLKNNADLPTEIVQKYELQGRNEQRLQDLKELILTLEMDWDSQYKELELQPEVSFKMKYINPLAKFEPKNSGQKVEFNKTVIEFVQTELSKIESIKEREEFIISFYIHTGYCKELVCEYVETKLSAILNTNSENTIEEIKELYIWIEQRTSFPKFQEFCIEKYGYKNTLSVEIGKIFQQYKEFIDSGDNEDVKLENIVLEQIIYKGSRESLSLFHVAQKYVGLVYDGENQRAASRVLSKAYRTDLKPFSERMIYDNFNANFRKNDEDNISFLIAKLQEMIAYLKMLRKNNGV